MKNYANIADPKDITTKEYVDNGLQEKLDLTGGTLTGDLTGTSITTNTLKVAAVSKTQDASKVAVFDAQGNVYYVDSSALEPTLSVTPPTSPHDGKVWYKIIE